MKWSELIAALAACGGLRTPGAVETALREAAAAPERDFRQLIDLVRSALRGDAIEAIDAAARQASGSDTQRAIA